METARDNPDLQLEDYSISQMAPKVDPKLDPKLDLKQGPKVDPGVTK